MDRVIFLTGATGLVGQNLIPRILRGDSDTRLILLVRANSDSEAHQRLNEILKTLAEDVDIGRAKTRIKVVRGDVSLSRLGVSETMYKSLVEDVTHIIHSAASVQLQLPLEVARRVNFNGTNNVLDFANHVLAAGNLQRVAYISTAYVSGNRGGVISEHELDCGQHFANTYEQSKFEAEQIVQRAMPVLPITIFRPSIIVGDSNTGRTTSFNVLYTPLKLIYRGIIKNLPGSRSTPVDVVPVNFVSDAVYHIFLQTTRGIGDTYHLTAGEEKASTSGEIVDLAVDYFNLAEKTQKISRVRFLPSGVCRLSKRFLRQQAQRMLQVMEAYEPYMCVVRIFDNSKTCAALRGTRISPPEFKSYHQSLLRYCIEVDWGRLMKFAA